MVQVNLAGWRGLVANTGMVLLVGWIVAMLLAPVGAQLVEDAVLSGLATDGNAVTMANYITGIYMMSLVAAMAVSTMLIFKTALAVRAFILAVVLAWAITFVIAAFGLYNYPGFVLGWDTWVIVPALYMIFVLRDPVFYMVLVAGVLAGAQFATNIIGGVHRE